MVFLCAVSVLLVTGCPHTTEHSPVTEENDSQKNYFDYGSSWNFNTEIKKSNTLDNVKPDLLNPNSNLSKALKKALSMNSLASGWTVTKPVYIFQHKNDDMVPPINITQVQNGIGKDNALVTCHVDETEITTSGQFDFIHSRAAGHFYELCGQDFYQNFNGD